MNEEPFQGILKSMNEDLETVGGVKIYNVKTEVFDGPFDILLNLIEKRKLFINDIALSQVADDFISYIKDQQHFPLQEGSHFIYIASTLILIKSRSLLPSLNLTEEEEEGIEDLEKRLSIYKRVKEEVLNLKEEWGRHQIFFGLGENFSHPVYFTPDESVTKKNLALCAYDIIDRVPTDSIIPQVKVNDVLKLETVINSLIRRVNTEINLSFNKFSGLSKSGPENKKERYKIVVSFIAVLELVKQGLLTARQEKDENDIYIENSDIKVPSYT